MVSRKIELLDNYLGILFSKKANVLKIYKTLIRSYIEYSSRAWAPVSRHGNWKVKLRLEGIQIGEKK